MAEIISPMAATTGTRVQATFGGKIIADSDNVIGIHKTRFSATGVGVSRLIQEMGNEGTNESDLIGI